MPEPPPSGKAERTRRDIVAAAIECWAVDNTASLSAVAAAAGVGRTTVNRYFAERAQLIEAVDGECRGRFRAAVFRARVSEGRGLDGLGRLGGEIIELGSVLGLIFADNALVDPDTWPEDDGSEADGPDAIGVVIVRGQEDGSIAADLPAEWIATLVWTSLFAAWLMIKSEGLTRHEATALMIRTLASGVATRVA